MAEALVAKVALIGALGVAAQWAAWRFQIPAIVLLATAGILAGPIVGVLDPARDFGELLQPAVAVAVAIILFEGGLNLHFRELKGVAVGVRRLVLVGAPVGWLLGSLAAHHIGGLSWPSAIVFAGILVVTGPTVIAPLLRQARLAHRPATALKWEGILNDPVGALFAVLAFEIVLALGRDSGSPAFVFGHLIFGALFAVALGIGIGWGAAWAFRRGHVPEFLKAPMLLGAILACFALSNAIYHETGLLAVTALGMTVGNSRIAAIEELRRIKEVLATILVSGVFVVLTATLTLETVSLITWSHVAFVAAVLFVVRPITVVASAAGTPMPWKERALLAWIAPRGIIAVAVSGLFGAKLVEAGIPDGALLVPLSFAVVLVTVVLHGFSIRPMARALGLTSTDVPGVLIVGGTAWSIELARALKDLKVPVTVADSNWSHLSGARQQGIPTYYGEVLSEVTEHQLNLSTYGNLVAASDNDSYNALVCTDFAPEMGRSNVYQTGAHAEPDNPRSRSFAIGGRTLLRSGADTDQLNLRLRQGWTFQKTKLSDSFTYEQYLEKRPEGAETILAMKPGGKLVFATRGGNVKALPGDTVLAFTPKEPKMRKPADTAEAAPSAA